MRPVFTTTVLPHSREVVVWGSKAGSTMIYIFCQIDGKIQQLREVQPSCVCSGVCLVGVIVEKQELLLVGCRECRDLKLINLLSGDVSVAYQKSDFKPLRMCAGEVGKLWVWMVNHEVVELNCSGYKFTSTGRKIDTKISACGLCYLPSPENALIVTPNISCVSLSCGSGEKQWEVEGQLDGKRISPRAVVFSPQYNVVLMVDRFNSRILVLDPTTGSHRQSLNVPGEVGVPGELCLHNDLLFMSSYHTGQQCHKISCLSIR